MYNRVPGSRFGIPTDRDQRNWVFPNDRKKYFAPEGKPPKKNFLKIKALKNNLLKHDTGRLWQVPVLNVAKLQKST